MEGIYAIGDFCFRLTMAQGITPPENFALFACEGGEPVYSYTMEFADAFPQPQGKPVAMRPDLAVFAQGNLEMRYLGMMGEPGFFACYREESESSARILLAPAMKEIFWVDPMFLSMFAMERRMAERSAIVLHCAYMALGEEAVLFSAPSGTGKSTQAGLWAQYRGTHQINGDRSLLRRIDGVWHACGWPVCGSSGICHNEARPIRAIVMLSQAKENSVRRLSPFEAFSKAYSQVTINSWNRAAQQRAMDLIEALIGSVPVYHLACDMSEDAVKCLEAALKQR